MQYYTTLHNITLYYSLRRILPNMIEFYKYASILHMTKLFDAALDGQNRSEFQWIDLIDFVRRQLEDPAFAGKLLFPSFTYQKNCQLCVLETL